MIRTLLLTTLIIGIAFIAHEGFAEDYALILGGAGGEKSFYDEFWSATSRMHDLLTGEYGYSPENITFLFEDEGEVPGLVDGKSTRANVESAFAELAQKVQPTDRFLLFTIGHATKQRRGLKFNLPGRDFSDTECTDWINQMAAEQMILFLGTPYSGRMVSQVSKAGRIIIVSCSRREGYMRSGFGNILVDAFSDGGADTDADGAISLLEAFLYTQDRVKAWYDDDVSVQSEHPHLDDDGNGIASRKALPKEQEGLLAQQTFLGKRRSPLMVATPPNAPDDATAETKTDAKELDQASDDSETELDDHLRDARAEDEGTANPSESASDLLRVATIPSASDPLRVASIPYDFISEADEEQIKALIADAADMPAPPDAGAVVLWEAEDLDINEDVSYIYSKRRVVKLFGEKGLKFGAVSVPYTRGSDNVTIHYARTITPDGRTIELDRRRIIKNIPPPSAVEAGLYVDARLMHFTMPEMSDGCIIDYAYSTNNVGHLKRGEFWRQVYFQTSEPVRYYRFAVHAPKKKQLYYHIHGPQIKPTITEANYTRSYTFETREIPPLREEEFMPALEDLSYSINISSLDSWDSLMEWYATLIREQDYITPDIEKKTKELLAGAWTRKEKIKRLYEYVAANIDYVGIELGIWAIKPRQAPKIFKDGYGDCKDKTTLLSTMLSVAGITSYPVLIPAGKSSKVVREIPSLAYFNHMILAAEENEDGDLIWLDPTAETCAFGDLPAGDQDRWTLIVNPDFLKKEKADDQEGMANRLYQFTKSPAIAAEENLKRVMTQIQVEKELSVKATQEIFLTGEFNTRLRSQLKYITPEQRAKFLHEYMELDNRAKLDGIEISDLDKMEDSLKITLTWHCADYLFAIGRQFVLELPLVKHPYAALLSEESRVHPVRIGKALTFEHEVKVNLPSSFSVDAVPEDREIDNGVGAIKLKYTKSNRKMVMKQTVRFEMPTVNIDQVAPLKELVRLASNPGTKRMMLIQK
jgi:hypothetical protein